MVAKFKPNPIWVAIITISIVVFFLIFFWALITYPLYTSSNTYISKDILFFILLILLLFYALGRSVSIDNNYISYIDFFIFKKKLPISEIQSISYPMTFLAGNENRTLTIYAEIDGKYKAITLPYPAFTKKTLVTITQYLTNKNKNIFLDDDIKILMNEKNGVGYH